MLSLAPIQESFHRLVECRRRLTLNDAEIPIRQCRAECRRGADGFNLVGVACWLLIPLALKDQFKPILLSSFVESQCFSSFISNRGVLLAEYRRSFSEPGVRNVC